LIHSLLGRNEFRVLFFGDAAGQWGGQFLQFLAFFLFSTFLLVRDSLLDIDLVTNIEIYAGFRSSFIAWLVVRQTFDQLFQVDRFDESQ